MRFANNEKYLTNTIGHLMANINDAHSMAVENGDKDAQRFTKRDFEKLEGLMFYFRMSERLDSEFANVFKKLDKCRSAAVMLNREADFELMKAEDKVTIPASAWDSFVKIMNESTEE